MRIMPFEILALLAEALCYKPEGSAFDSRRDKWIIFQLTKFFQPNCGPLLD
jgi:hypothetical protein